MIERILKLERLVKWIYCKVKNGGIGGGIQSVREGDNITVDNTDPLNPIISSTGGDTDQENIIRVPSATYSELGITPESTNEDKQAAIAAFLEGYDNSGEDVLMFEIKDEPIVGNFDMRATWDTMGVTDQATFESWFSRSIYGGGFVVDIKDFVLNGDRITATATYKSVIYGGIAYKDLLPESGWKPDSNKRLISVDKIGEYDSIGSSGSFDFNLTGLYRPILNFDFMEFINKYPNITEVFFNLGGSFFLQEDLDHYKNFINTFDMDTLNSRGTIIKFNISDYILDIQDNQAVMFTGSELDNLMTQKGIIIHGR